MLFPARTDPGGGGADGAGMKLHEWMARQGGFLFRWRSYVPLLFAGPALLGLGAVQKLRGRWLAWRAKQNSHAAKAAQPTKEAP